MKIWLLATAMALSNALWAQPSQGIGIGNQGDLETATPQSGQNMDKVRAQHGEPERRDDAVGEPPITRWIYQGFTVYFEHDKVIHAVRHR